MFNKILLFWVTLDKKQFRKMNKNSCTIKIHPSVNLLDENIQKQIKEHIECAIDLIRDNIDINDI
jgi:hypothetical protein